MNQILMWLWDDLCIWTSLKLSRKKLTTTLKTEHFSLHNTIFCVARVFSLVKCITKSCWKIFLRANEFCMVESRVLHICTSSTIMSSHSPGNVLIYYSMFLSKIRETEDQAWEFWIFQWPEGRTLNKSESGFQKLIA